MHEPQGWALKNETGLRKWAQKHKHIQNSPSAARTGMLTVQRINCDLSATSGLGGSGWGAVHMNMQGWAVRKETGK